MDAFHYRDQQVVLVISKQTRDPLILSGLYARMEYRDRRVLWSEISKIVTQGLPSLVVGNFNCIMGAHEKIGGK